MHLYDLDDNICAVWDFLINASETDVMAMNQNVRTQEDYDALPNGVRQLFFWNVQYVPTNVSRKLPLNYLKWIDDPSSTPHYNFCSAWSKGRKKKHIMELKSIMVDWRITQGSYDSIPDELIETAHFHVDPPYMLRGGTYVHSEIDYGALGKWCRKLPCADICEGEDADWLPFRKLYDVESGNRRDENGKSILVPEMIWSPDYMEQHFAQMDFFD